MYKIKKIRLAKLIFGKNLDKQGICLASVYSFLFIRDKNVTWLKLQTSTENIYRMKYQRMIGKKRKDFVESTKLYSNY